MERSTALRVLLVLALLAVPHAAGAVTLRDIIELSKAGLPDDILVAVIDADRTVFTLDPDQILELRTAGVSDAVLLKMIRTRREFDAAPPPPPAPPPVPEPGIVVIGGDPKPEPVTVVVPQYFFVPYPIWGAPPRGPRTPPAPFLAPQHRGFGRFINDGWVDRER